MAPLLIRVLYYTCSYDTSQLSGGGKYHFWGVENLQAPLRTNRSWSSLLEGVSSLELTPFDGSANPHLGLAAILAAGIDGLRKHIHAPEPMGKYHHPFFEFIFPFSLCTLFCNAKYQLDWLANFENVVLSLFTTCLQICF